MVLLFIFKHFFSLTEIAQLFREAPENKPDGFNGEATL